MNDQNAMSNPSTAAADAGSITQVAGIEVGHFTDARRPTGCTVIIARGPDGLGAVGGVDVRGAAPGTRETDLLHPSNLVDRVHAVLLAGGSAWGLDAAGGVMQWLEENNIGLAVGYAACAAASRQAPLEGNVGAGTGALVGKIFGMARAMKGGIGTASITVDGITVGAIVACNALGDVVDPATGKVIAGARTVDGTALLDSRSAIIAGTAHKPVLAGSNTTIGVVATDAVLTKAQAHRLAQVAHDGLARAINPVHTMSDGDTMFALGTGASGKTAGMTLLGTLAAEVTARAIVRAVLAAKGVTFGANTWPAASELARI